VPKGWLCVGERWRRKSFGQLAGFLFWKSNLDAPGLKKTPRLNYGSFFLHVLLLFQGEVHFAAKGQS